MDAPCVAVAYSGGRDSTALLHATLAAASEQGLRVVALHVHHGLSAHADEWLMHCAQQCRRWAARGLPVSFDHRRLEARPERGDSVEAWARQARYAALREMAVANAAPVVLLAHHRQDQAETLLLQALRGAGVAGLAAMPRVMARGGITWLRPWLEASPDAVAAYARRYRLRHVDDDSNAERRFARNRLRLDVWPALRAAFPQAEGSLAATATWANEARECADELASIDLAQIADAQGLLIADWARLAPARRSNALRAWLKALTGRPATAATVERLLAELPARSPATWQLDGFELRRYRGRLSCRAEKPHAAATQPGRVATLSVQVAGTYPLPGWGGRLRVQCVEEGGVAMPLLRDLRLVERRGGERFQRAHDRPARSLKKQFQLEAVPAWERGGPLIYASERLLYVPGLGIDSRARAAKGVAQAGLWWLPDVG